MEEKIDLIKGKLTGNYGEDIEYLNVLYNAQNKIVEDALATIEAINIVLEELNKEQTNDEIIEENTQNNENIVNEEENKEENEERTQEQEEIDNLIVDLTKNINSGNIEEALKNAEEVIPKIETISKTENENALYCSFSSDFEKMIFQNIFAGEKKVKVTPYANDEVYILYSDILLNKKRRKAAMDALDRAIYWNFLSREAREKKIDLYFMRKEIVKCLDAIKKLQMISYTAQDIATCYNKYAYVFESLKDSKSAYALYRLSYSYYENESVMELISNYEEQNPTFKDLTPEELIKIAQDNEVEIGPNNKIIKAHRDITTKLIENGAIEGAKMMIQNDYSMTREEAIANIYNQLIALDNPIKDVQEDIQEDEKVNKAKKASNRRKKKVTVTE